ncbi:DivIVA domain-containing protein [Mumia flava]|uniref:DivIVA domain-containing protein n=1 Tax=Mumia flava TaxID=1348852 RepID=A0A0B2B2N0_9ACTN|nr:DivIVA domain-containing protein [Mumia flava]PJJ56717.1 DivIVA domain-containing protein [Mumia flava]
MFWILVVIGALAAGAAVTVLATSFGALGGPADSRRDLMVPTDRPLRADDLAAVRFSWAWRGYARDEVDGLLARLEADAREREAPTGSAEHDGDADSSPPAGPGERAAPPVDTGAAGDPSAR